MQLIHGSNSNLERPRLTSPPHIMMLMVCRPPTRPHAHESMSGGRGRMMHSSSSCSLATRTTSRRNGTRTSVTGMIQIARSRISIVVAAVGLVLPLAGDFCLCWCGDLTSDLAPLLTSLHHSHRPRPARNWEWGMMDSCRFLHLLDKQVLLCLVAGALLARIYNRPSSLKLALHYLILGCFIILSRLF